MKGEVQRVVFPAPECAALESLSDELDPAPDEVLLRTEWSLISTGTELALYTNQNDIGHSPSNPYPVYPGYAAVGTILEAGKAIAGLSPGDWVFAITGHRSHVKFKPSKTFCLRLPNTLPGEHATFIRMALISLATLCRADIRAGEWLGVVGLGLIGNLAAQLGLQAGYNVTGVGRSSLRSEVAAKCGIGLILAEEPEKIASQVNRLSSGLGCQLVLDTTGTTGGLLKAIALAGKGGTISLVGVPWLSDAAVAATEIMQPVFTNYLKLQGGWEWDLLLYEKEPDQPLPMVRHRHSVESNAKHALELIRKGLVQVEPLITHRISPPDVQEAYQGLLHQRNAYLGVLIDWRQGQ